MSDTESALLGCVLMYPKMMDMVAGIVKVDDFGSECHQTIYRGMLSIRDKFKALDLLTLRDELETEGTLVRAGSVAYLSALTESACFSGHCEQYANTVVEKAKRRNIRDAISGAAATLDNGADEIDTATTLITDIDAIGSRSNMTEARDIKDIVRECIEPDKKHTCLTTGYDSIDAAHCGGIEPGSLTIIGAAPSIGKSQLAICISAKAKRADKQPARVLFVSLEMSAAMLFERLCGAAGNIEMNTVRAIRLQGQGNYYESNVDKLLRAADAIYKLPLLIYDRAAVSADELRCIVSRYQNDIDLLVVDYLQLMRAERRQSKREAVEAGSKACKEIAKRYKIPVIAVASLNRGGYQEADTRPNLSHLKECGDIEYDADQVWMLWRPKENPHQEVLELDIKKQRQGALSGMEFDYHLKTGAIVERTEEGL